MVFLLLLLLVALGFLNPVSGKYHYGLHTTLFGNLSCDSTITGIETDSKSNVFVSGHTFCPTLRSSIDELSSCNRLKDTCSTDSIPFVFREEGGQRKWTLLMNSTFTDSSLTLTDFSEATGVKLARYKLDSKSVSVYNRFTEAETVRDYHLSYAVWTILKTKSSSLNKILTLNFDTGAILYKYSMAAPEQVPQHAQFLIVYNVEATTSTTALEQDITQYTLLMADVASDKQALIVRKMNLDSSSAPSYSSLSIPVPTELAETNTADETFAIVGFQPTGVQSSTSLHGFLYLGTSVQKKWEKTTDGNTVTTLYFCPALIKISIDALTVSSLQWAKACSYNSNPTTPSDGPFYSIDVLHADYENDRVYGLASVRNSDYEQQFSDHFGLIGTVGIATQSKYSTVPAQDTYGDLEFFQVFVDHSQYFITPLGFSKRGDMQLFVYLSLAKPTEASRLHEEIRLKSSEFPYLPDAEIPENEDVYYLKKRVLEYCDNSANAATDQCYILSKLTTSKMVLKHETVRIALSLHKQGHPGISKQAHRATLHNSQELKYSHYVSRDLTLFQASTMYKIFSEDRIYKGLMTELYDQDILGGHCSFGSGCLRLMLDSQIAKELDQTKVGSLNNVKSLLLLKPDAWVMS